MNKWIKIGIVAVVIIGFTFTMAQLQEKGIINKPKEVIKVQEDKKDIAKENEVIEGSCKEGNINVYINLGTGFSDASLEKNMKHYIAKHMENIRKDKDFVKLQNICFVFNGDTNNGNAKIAQFDFDDKALSLLPPTLTKENVFDYVSDKWIKSK